VLLGIGWVIGNAGGTLARDVVELYTRHAILVMVPLAVLLVGGYVWWHRRRSRTTRTPSPTADGRGPMANG